VAAAAAAAAAGPESVDERASRRVNTIERLPARPTPPPQHAGQLRRSMAATSPDDFTDQQTYRGRHP